MGLLDSLDDPKTAGLLSIGLRLMSTPGSFGQALGQSGMGALSDLQAARQQAAQRQAQAQQMDMQRQQMATNALHQSLTLQQIEAARQQAADAAQARAREEQFRALIPSPTGQAASSALAGGGGPTVANSAAMPAVDPQVAMLHQAMMLGQIKPLDYINATKKDNAPIKLAAGEGLYQPGTFKPLVLNPKDDAPSAIKEYNFAKAQGYPGTFQQFQLEMKKAGATNVSLSAKMGDSFGTAFSKDVASDLAASRDQARAAATSIGTLDRIGRALDTGKVAIGPGAPFEVFGRQLAESLGIGGKDNAEKLANTRQVIQGAAGLALDGAAALKGQGQVTEGERALVARAAGGDIDKLTQPEMRSLLGVLRKVNSAKIQMHQSQLKKVGPEFQPFVPFYQVDEPPAPVGGDGWSIKPKGQ